MSKRPAVRIVVTVTPQVADAIDTLLETGLFGRSRGQLAHRLISEGVVKHVEFAGLLPERKSRRRA